MAARKKKEVVTPAPESGGVGLVFLGLFMTILGVFLGLSFATTDLALDPMEQQTACATGMVGAWASYGIVLTLGHHASFFLAGLVSAWGIMVMQQKRFLSTWPNVFGGVVMLVSFSMLVDSFINSEMAGGLLADYAGTPARLYFGGAGLTIIACGTMFLGAVLSFGSAAIDAAHAGYGFAARTAIALARAFSAFSAAVIGWMRPKVAEAFVTSADRAIVLADRYRQDRDSRGASSSRKKNVPESDALEVEAAVVEEKSAEPAPRPEPEPQPVHERPVEVERAPEFKPYGLDDDDDLPEEPEEFTAKVIYKEPKKKRPRPEKIDKIEAQFKSSADYQLPPLNLLQPAEESKGEGQATLEKRARRLEQTLAEFKIDGKVVQIEYGPRVTMFEMMLAPGIRLSKVINLADNIAMGLKASNVRIIAPIPGKDTIGIEIPNIEQQLVTLREVVESINRENRKQAIPLCLSKDVSGKAVVADLAKMPHLLIAGSTGSGKSVCINSILLSFLMCCKPQDLKCILIDPKVVELSRFKDIPHLMSPVITDMKRAVGVMEWACQKMDERYEQLSMVSVNNITKFNALGEEEIVKRLGEIYNEDELKLFPKHLPYIIIVIDELADLMMIAGKDIEQHITRLAAKSRAVGIHLILATQRPSVDVITGLIKANMPSRIAFQVASKVDSRTILDQNGAETLLGAGDMLYLPPGVGKVIRSQGVFVSDEELFDVVDFCKDQMAPEYHADLEGPVIGGSASTDIKDFDELFLESGLAIIESGRGSVSLLQRKLGIGYGRASRIIDQLASVGVLGPFREGKAREILLTADEFCDKFGGAQMAMQFDDDDDSFAGLRDDEKGPTDFPWDSDIPE